MSFKVQPTPPARPNRCQLFGPGSNTKLHPKMAASAADVINLDLEDAVAPDDKPQARKNIIEAINTLDWGKKTVCVRINGLDTPYWYRDVVEVLEETNGRLDMIMIPKVGCAADVYAVDALVSAIEAAKGATKRIALEVIIETAAGLAHVEEIAASSPRMQAMSLGAADFAASMGMSTTGIGGTAALCHDLACGGERASYVFPSAPSAHQSTGAASRSARAVPVASKRKRSGSGAGRGVRRLRLGGGEGGIGGSGDAEEDEGSWGDEGAPDVMMTFDGENWVPRRSSFDASSI